jgi:hypothetical protein
VVVISSLKSDNSSTPLTQIYCYDNCVKIAKGRYTNIDIMLAHIRAMCEIIMLTYIRAMCEIIMLTYIRGMLLTS